MVRDWIRMYLVVLLLAISVAPVLAQEIDLRDDQGLENITVTAQKQEENVQDVPMSITVLSGLEIEDKKIDGLWDLMDHIPSLMNFDTGMSDMFSQPSMRGITAPSNTFNSSVGLYVDGVPIVSSPGFTASMVDIERVEVLRGPQGTLYGKNSEAGVINIVTRQPDNQWRGKVQVEGGEDKKRSAMLSVSGPIVPDKLFFGLVGQHERKDGYIKNENLGGYDNDRERYYGRGQIRWTPTDNLDISFVMSRLTSDEGGENQTGNETMMALYGLPALPERTSYSGQHPHKETYHDIQSLIVKYSLNDAVDITSVTARKVTDWASGGDADYSPSHIYHMYMDSQYSSVSQELRLNWNSGKMRGLVGLYADRHMNDHNMYIILPDNSSTPDTERELGGDSYAVFGQVDYSITEAFHLVAGLRYEKQKMDFDDAILLIEAEESWNKITPKLSLQYRFNSQFNMYIAVAEGYRTGGFNNTATDLEYQTFEPEELWNYEIGLKTSFFDNRLVVNASLYYMDISDMQVEEWVSPLMTYVTNAAEATSVGCEIEVVARITKGLTVNAGFGYNDTEFDNFTDSGGDYSGNKNPFAPEYTFNLGGKYRHSSGFYLSSDVLAYGEIYTDKNNKNVRDAYEILNAKIGYETEKIDIYIYADNLFDARYDAMNYYGYYNNYSAPREVGVQYVYRF